jgi:YQGE family putative transporter
MIGGYDFNFALSSAFINIFLFKRDQDWTVVEVYNMVMYAAIMLAFWVGGHMAKKLSHLLPYQLGFGFNALVFLLVLVLREKSPDHPGLLGFFAGLGIGFYYLGQHFLTLDLTESRTRDYFLSLSLFLSSILRILAPALAGWIILGFKGSGSDSSSGYYVVFTMTLLVYLFLIYKSLSLKIRETGGGFDFWKVLTFPGNRDWNRQMWAQFILGIRNGAFWFVISVLVYQVSKNEGIVGSYNMMANFLAVLTAYGLSLWAEARHRERGLLISSSLAWVACAFLAAGINYISLLGYGLLNAVAVTWFSIVFAAVGFEVLERARSAHRYKLEYLAARELPLWLGRTLGLGAMMLSQHYLGELGLRLSLLVLGGMHMGVFFFLPRQKRAES